MEEREATDAIVRFWRAFFAHVGPEIGLTEDQVSSPDDVEIVQAGEKAVEGFAVAAEIVGTLIGRGVNAYRKAVR